MNDFVATFFTVFLYALIFAIIGRALMSWFPIDQRGSLARGLVQVTEPILEPLRRILPRFGMIDLSPMVAVILLTIMVQVVARAADA